MAALLLIAVLLGLAAQAVQGSPNAALPTVSLSESEMAALKVLQSIVSPMLLSNTVALTEELLLVTGGTAGSNPHAIGVQIPTSSFDAAQSQARRRRTAGDNTFQTAAEARQALRKCAARNVSRPCSQLLRIFSAQGILQGYFNAEGSVRIWQKIPYALPPTGERRFAKAVPPPETTANTIYWATNPAPACPQARAPPLNAFFQYATLPHGMSEDCLYLNVYAPGSAVPRSKYPFGYPVYVWLHGSTFDSGASNMETFNGESFAKNNIIVVTVNYRLGALGFLNTNGTINLGLHDQALALAWVRKNIIKFGGDPEQVTLGGHGTSAATLGAHVAQNQNPLDRSFHRIIVQNNLLQADTWIRSRSETYFRDFLPLVNCSSGSTAQRLDCLRSLPVSAILRAQSTLGSPLPVRDARDYLPSDPLALTASALSLGLPMLVGLNSNSGASLLTPAVKAFDRGFFDQFFRIAFSPSVGPLLASLYPWPAGATTGEAVFGLMYSDVHMFCPLRNQLRRVLGVLNNTPPAAAYMYLFDGTISHDCHYGTQSACSSGTGCFAQELPFTFNASSCAAYSGLQERFDFSSAETQLASRMHMAWVNFIHTGNPNNGPHTLPTAWPAFDLSENALRFSSSSPTVFSGHRAAQCNSMPTFLTQLTQALKTLGL
jgi:para-nitrobenzyl esterase